MQPSKMPTEVAVAVSALLSEFMICLAATGIISIFVSLMLDINMYFFVTSMLITQIIIRFYIDKDNRRYVKTIWFWQKHKLNSEINGFPDSTYRSDREKADNNFLNTMEGRKFHEDEPKKPKTLKESASKSLLDD